MHSLEIANKTSFELQQLEIKIKSVQKELNALLRDKEIKQYFISLIEKELTEQELEIFNKLRRNND
jgi:hypothetical protein